MFGVQRRWSRDSERRGVPLVLLTVGALLLHAALLQGLEWQVRGSDESGFRRQAVDVRVLQPEPQPAAAPPATAMVAEPAAPAVPQPRSARRLMKKAASPAAPAQERPSPPPLASGPLVAEPLPLELEPPETTAPLETSVAAVPEASAGSAAAGSVSTATSAPTAQVAAGSVDVDRELPVYRTRIPPPTTLRYQMRRGALQGTGEFRWAVEGPRYEAHLEGSVAGIRVLTQISQGGFDEAGVAPLRFTDQRVTGSTRAANFQRDIGKITFSGPSVEHTLLIGSQDRLSWMVQLAAVVSAEPQRLQAGGKVVIHVVGARGDSRLWIFRFAEQEAIKAASGTAIRAAKFVREGLDPYDTRVEVWLDPQRHHLPARAVLRSGPDDEGMELLVLDALAIP